ncbi:hypothetical protein C8R44DRAFT_652264 [Mycena epipterygia]|nr:hypothetical protein C8R44DRAFT_652264 [Mycena epipterygia]
MSSVYVVYSLDFDFTRLTCLSECSKSFKHLPDLACHEKLHSGEKPYPCEFDVHCIS